AFYRGWSATVNGQAAAVKPSAEGLLSVDVPAGESEVEAEFGSTPDRLAGTVISALSLLGLAIAFRQSRKRVMPAAEPSNDCAHHNRVLAALAVLALAGGGLAWARQAPPAPSPAAQPMDL